MTPEDSKLQLDTCSYRELVKCGHMLTIFPQEKYSITLSPTSTSPKWLPPLQSFTIKFWMRPSSLPLLLHAFLDSIIVIIFDDDCRLRNSCIRSLRFSQIGILRYGLSGCDIMLFGRNVWRASRGLLLPRICKQQVPPPHGWCLDLAIKLHGSISS